MQEKNDFRKWLFDKRKLKQMTQNQVAKKADIKRPYYSMIENGIKTPSTTVAQKLGDVLDFDWTIFFTVEGNYTTHEMLKKEVASS